MQRDAAADQPGVAALRHDRSPASLQQASTAATCAVSRAGSPPGWPGQTPGPVDGEAGRGVFGQDVLVADDSGQRPRLLTGRSLAPASGRPRRRASPSAGAGAVS